MTIDKREMRAEPAQSLAWATAAEWQDDPLGAAVLWLGGGVALLAWTVLAMVLTLG